MGRTWGNLLMFISSKFTSSIRPEAEGMLSFGSLAVATFVGWVFLAGLGLVYFFAKKANSSCTRPRWKGSQNCPETDRSPKSSSNLAECLCNSLRSDAFAGTVGLQELKWVQMPSKECWPPARPTQLAWVLGFAF